MGTCPRCNLDAKRLVDDAIVLSQLNYDNATRVYQSFARIINTLNPRSDTSLSFDPGGAYRVIYFFADFPTNMEAKEAQESISRLMHIPSDARKVSISPYKGSGFTVMIVEARKHG